MTFSNKRSLALCGTALGLILAVPLAAVAPALAAEPGPIQTAPAQSTEPTEAQKSAAAQDTELTADSEGLTEEEKGDVTAVIVTGTSIRGVKPVGSESVTITREEIESSGLSNISEILNTIPQFQNLNGGGNNENESGRSVDDRSAGSTFGANQSGNSGLNLRGMGNDGTLILMDGHPIAASGGESVQDANQIPLSALERVEVVMDGASAIYGANAIAGVVNYVIRKDYAGVEGQARYSTQRGGDQWSASVTMGRAWDLFDGGNALFTYDYSNRSPILKSSSPFFDEDQRSVGGNNMSGLGGTTVSPPSLTPYLFRQSCSAGTLVLAGALPFNHDSATCNVTTTNAQGQSIITPTPQNLVFFYYAIPPGTTGVPTAASVLAQPFPVFINNADYTDERSKQVRNSGTLYVRQDINENIQLSLQASYNTREDDKRNGLSSFGTAGAGAGVFNVANPTAAAPNALFIAGIPGAAATGTAYQIRSVLGTAHTHGRNASLNSAFTARIKLPGSWAADLSYTVTHSNDTGRWLQRSDGFVNLGAAPAATGSAPNQTPFQRAVAAGTYTPYNPAASTPEVIKSLQGESLQPNSSNNEVVRAKFDGPVFTLPGGQVRTAIGAEWSLETSTRAPTISRREVSPGSAETVIAGMGNPNALEQEVSSAFYEFYVPVVGRDNQLPGVKALVLNISGRYDQYSADHPFNPKYGLQYRPVDDVTVRATYSTSFRQPGLQLRATGNLNINIIQTNVKNTTTAPSPYAASKIGPNPAVILYTGRKKDLLPESSKSHQFGFDYDPHQIPGLRVSGTYYYTNYINKLDTPENEEFLNRGNEIADQSSDLITLINQDPVKKAACVVGDPTTYDPALIAGLGQEAFDDIIEANRPIPGVCTAPILFDSRIGNNASQLQTGHDISIRYRFNTDILGGTGVTTSISVNAVDKAESLRNKGDAPVPHMKNYIGGTISPKGRGQIQLDHGAWNVGLSANYTGAYVNDQQVVIQGQMLPIYTVPSNTTLDLTVSWRARPDAPEWLRGVRGSLSVNNLTDKDPPYAPSTSQSATPTGQGGPAGGARVFDTSQGNAWGRITTLNVTKQF